MGSEITDENLSPRKRSSLSRKLFDEKSSKLINHSRPPLRPIDINTMTSAGSNISGGVDYNIASSSGWRAKKQDRILKKKAQQLIQKKNNGSI